jgi:hypothetical protein
MHLCYFVLSCIYAKNSGFDIKVHCDKRAELILQIAPYDEIITDLEEITPPANSRIYAWSKFESMKNEPLGTIHIDGDVFLKSPKLQKLLNFDNYDCIVQCLENKRIFGGDQNNIWRDNSSLFVNCKYPYWAKRECDYMFNCGVIGINNAQLKNEYFNTYADMVKQYNETNINIPGTCPDIIIEQQFLKDLTDAKGYNVKCLLPVDNHNMLHSYASSIGYQHLIGDAKRRNLNKCLEVIKYYDKQIYCDLMDIKNDLKIESK